MKYGKFNELFSDDSVFFKFLKFILKLSDFFKVFENLTMAIPDPERLKFPGYPYCPTFCPWIGCIPGREYLYNQASQYRLPA